MLNAEFFRAAFAAASAAEPRQRTELHLQSGAIFEVASVHAIEEGYVTLQVFPPDDAEGATLRGRSGVQATGDAAPTDRLAVAYESISCVHFAPAVRHAGRGVGF